MVVLVLIAGLVLLSLGAELLVRGASRLAAAVGISPLVIGLTVVAFGTSAPELVVSVQSTLRGEAEIALGNVVGSNIFNVLFILGVSALIIPLRVAQQLIRFDVPLMIGLSFLVLLLGYDGRIGRLDGLLLSVGLLSYTIWAVVKSRRESGEIVAEYNAEFGPISQRRAVSGHLLNGLVLIVGLALLILGSRWFVDAAISIARHFEISELVIGLTIVAAGTSLPEVATSIMAAVKGERDIAVGNVVGSNLFNIMGVLGLAGLIAPTGIDVSATAFQLDIPVMIAVAVSCLPIFVTGFRIARWEGALFLLYYGAYTTHLIIAATSPALSRNFTFVMLGFVIPLTTIALATSFLRHLREGKAKSEVIHRLCR